jgi:hypothetical protein
MPRFAPVCAVKTLPLLAGMLALSGCFNMPTETAQIAGVRSSGLKYEQLSCRKLRAEMDALSRRENQLAQAQEQRIKSSQMQAFWFGFGQGDGIEASELASVRGDKEAVQTALDGKKCK